MERTNDNCSIALVVITMIVLAINYGYVDADSLSVTAGWLSLAGVKATNDLFVPILAISLLIGLCVCHVTHHWYEISDRYSAGYRDSPAVIELVRGAVAVAVKNDSYGSPRGGIRGSLVKRRKTDLGRFQMTGGGLSEPVIVEPSCKVHLHAVFYGLKHSIALSLWLKVYAPLVLAVWGLLSIAI
ncbi:MAG: hypothetical protein AB1642_04645 [Pseudomonadota bacterium]